MSRTCKKCGTIEYDIWGYVGMLGYSLLIGALGYSLSLLIYYPRLVVVAVIFGVIFMLPMYFISIHEQRASRNQ